MDITSLASQACDSDASKLYCYGGYLMTSTTSTVSENFSKNLYLLNIESLTSVSQIYVVGIPLPSRQGHSPTFVGSSLYLFGGEDPALKIEMNTPSATSYAPRTPLRSKMSQQCLLMTSFGSILAATGLVLRTGWPPPTARARG
ncbi:hypothetical protein BDK51DRAFT_37730 [Blyttiomyces helicus]|uniref:Uncharacterized protein n=1 Tax=Blyttiomyces helicus TaxID=388810 RepID=A0A4V1IPI9_9FUNG|nr:hypothetical protein BDK51DRAFT_37730 [Blyttiomyces helicus]|eukprot:RKO83217.1 hypothetical protein BDK51DRAFT_37730 [Blyttiomyces helicus]